MFTWHDCGIDSVQLQDPVASPGGAQQGGVRIASASRATGGPLGSGQLAAASAAAVVRMTAAFRREAWAQHSMVLTY